MQTKNPKQDELLKAIIEALDKPWAHIMKCKGKKVELEKHFLVPLSQEAIYYIKQAIETPK